MKKEDLDRLTANVDHWDESDPKAKIEFLDANEGKKLDKEIDDALGLQPVTIRLQKSVVEELKKLAKADGIGYQPLVRQILARYVAARKQQSASSAASRAAEPPTPARRNK